MAVASSDHESLVQAIVQVLTANPSLLVPSGGSAGSFGGAPSLCADGQCIACGSCISKRTDSVKSIIGGERGMRLTSTLGLGQVPGDIAKLIDHTLLRPEATYADIDRLCDEAKKYGFASVCVNPMHVKRCA